MTSIAKDFLNRHSAHFLEMALETSKRERVTNPDGYGKRTGDCGDSIEMFITLDGDIIRAVSFDTDGCLDTHACANTVAHLSEGKSLEDAWKISPQDVEDYLETLSPDHLHCAELSVGAFYLALSNCREMKQSGWKKIYRTR